MVNIYIVLFIFYELLIKYIGWISEAFLKDWIERIILNFKI
jgi:hypothetical protein